MKRGGLLVERPELEDIPLRLRIARVAVTENTAVVFLVQHREDAVTVFNGAPAQHLTGKLIDVLFRFLRAVPLPAYIDFVQIEDVRVRRKALVNGGVHQLCRQMVAPSFAAGYDV